MTLVYSNGYCVLGILFLFICHWLSPWFIYFFGILLNVLVFAFYLMLCYLKTSSRLFV